MQSVLVVLSRSKPRLFTRGKFTAASCTPSLLQYNLIFTSVDARPPPAGKTRSYLVPMGQYFQAVLVYLLPYENGFSAILIFVYFCVLHSCYIQY